MADPFSSWGPEESGVRIADQDARARGKDALQAYETLGKIAMQPAHQELYTQQARHWKAQADQDELENDAMRRMRQEMQGGGPLKEDPIEALYDIANRAAKAGSVKEATTALQRASQGIQQRAMAERAMSQAELAQINGEIKKRDTFANMLGGVTNQSTLDAMNQMYEQAFGEPSPLQGKPFDPKQVRQLQESTLTAKDRLYAQIKQVEERGRNWGRSIQDRHNKATEEIQRGELERKKEYDKVRDKGGKVGKPNPGDLTSAEILLKEREPDIKGDGLKLARDSIASRAMELMKANRGIGRTQAIQQAYNEEVEAGSFEKGPRFNLPVIGEVGETKKYVGMGRTPATARPMPAGDGKFQKGTYYVTAMGRLKFNGKDFDPPDEDDEDDE